MAMILISAIWTGLTVLARGFAPSTGYRSGIAQNASIPNSSVLMEEKGLNALIVSKLAKGALVYVSTQ